MCCALRARVSNYYYYKYLSIVRWYKLPTYTDEFLLNIANDVCTDATWAAVWFRCASKVAMIYIIHARTAATSWDDTKAEQHRARGIAALVRATVIGRARTLNTGAF